ncbi:MAG: 4-hydroxy-tetrahydrodipicolinate reductase [Canibacter sp.]
MTLKVAVLGANGRMGSAAVEAIRNAEDMELIATLGRDDDLDGILGATHVVDLTVPDATETNVRFAVENNIHAVVGTTGWNTDRLSRLESLLADHTETGVLIAPNFAIGAVLATSFAAYAAKFFESAEIVELHHPKKVDAPSGTAARTAELMGEARDKAGIAFSPDATESDPDGARGAMIHNIHVHSVRLQGLTAHQEILLGNAGEQLTIRHDSFDRGSFMPGVLLGLRKVAGNPGLTHGLDGYLDL